LLAIDQFLISQIVALQFDQVECDLRHLMIVAAAPQRVEIGNAIVATNDDLAIDQERWRPQAASSLHDGRKSIGPVIPAARP
jgi:hypothetical protein